MKTNLQNSVPGQNKVQPMAGIFKFFVGLLLLSLFAVSCTKEEDFSPVANGEAVLQTPQAVSDSKDLIGDGSFDEEDSRLKSASSTASSVSITSVTGTIVRLSRFTGDFLAIDTDGQDVLTINGTGFGASRGNGLVYFTSLSTYFITGYVSWSNTQIKVRVKSSYNSVPAPSSLNKNLTPTIVVKSNSGQSAARNVRVATRVTTKSWGQCTWWANKRRGETGRSVQARGQAYSNYSGSINSNYVPRAGDILIWSGRHQAFIESVSVSSGNWVNNKRDVTYTIKISEYNVISAETYSDYTTKVTIRETKAINGTITRSIVSGLYRSGLKTSATNYYR